MNIFAPQPENELRPEQEIQEAAWVSGVIQTGFMIPPSEHYLLQEIAWDDAKGALVNQEGTVFRTLSNHREIRVVTD